MGLSGRSGSSEQASHLGPTLSPRPGLVISQAMAFGLFWCKHSDPEIAVELVRPMFTLRLRYEPESKLPPPAPDVLCDGPL